MISVSPGSDFSLGWDPELLNLISFWGGIRGSLENKNSVFLLSSTTLKTVSNFLAAGLRTKSVVVYFFAIVYKYFTCWDCFLLQNTAVVTASHGSYGSGGGGFIGFGRLSQV